jgi:LPS sulfotransferase NodH
MKKDGLRFLILGDVRTGSTLLSRIFMGHPQIEMCAIEPFWWQSGTLLHRISEAQKQNDEEFVLRGTWAALEAGKAVGLERDRLLKELYGEKIIEQFSDHICDEPWWIRERPSPEACCECDLTVYLKHLWDQYNGFKLLSHQFPWENNAWKYLKSQTDIKIISLTRRNKFRQYVSHALSSSTGVWGLFSGQQDREKKLDDCRITIDIDNMHRMMEYWIEAEAFHREWFGNHDVYHLHYEDLVSYRSDVESELFEFLGIQNVPIEPQEDHPLPIKGNRIAMSRRIENYKDVCQAIANSDSSTILTPSAKCVFTVMTNNYLAESLSCLHTMKEYESDVDYWIIVADDKMPKYTLIQSIYSEYGIRVVSAKSLIRNKIITELSLRGHDCLRWTLKPFLLKRMLDDYERVIYVDNDLYFMDKFDFLFEDLVNHGVILTPHWRPSSPLTNEEQFIYSLSHGLFNAGFIGVSDLGRPALDYWAECCRWRCDRNFPCYDDQKYLDLMPVVYGDMCKIIRHRGCNLAVWNESENYWLFDENGQRQWPIIFLHLTEDWIKSQEKYEKTEISEHIAAHKQKQEHWRFLLKDLEKVRTPGSVFML